MESQLRVLGAVAAERSVKEVSTDLGYSPQYTHELVSELANMGLVDVEKRGREKWVGPVESTPAVLYRDLITEKPYIDFANLFAGTMIEVLYALDEPRTVAEIAIRTGLSRATVTRRVNTLTNRGIVTKRHGEYELREEYSTFNKFAQALVRQQHRATLREVSMYGGLVWETTDAFLARTGEKIERPEYHLTGLDRLADYGLDFYTTSEWYYLWTKDWTPEVVDIACHLLLIDDDSRMQKYTALFVKHVALNHDALLNRAEYYSIRDRMEEIVLYLDSKGEHPEEYAPWSEFVSLADEYGVEL